MTNKKNTRRALFLSVISLMLCCAMLVGTTFAWFTDSVTSGINTIQAGNLDVELYHSNKTASNEPVSGETKLFDNVTLWEPGAVAYENLQIANEGTLALKYQMALNFANATKTAEGKTLADVLKVAVVEGGFKGGRTDAQKLDYDYSLSSFALEGNLVAGAESDVYGIVVYWMPGEDDNAFNMNNGETTVLSIDLGINLFATQLENEEDSFGSDYDLNNAIFVSSAEELRAAIENVQESGTIVLNDGTYNIDSQLTIPGKSVNIVGSGENAVINMTDTRTNYNKIFYIYGSAEGKNITVNIDNVALTADVATKSDIWIRTDAQDGTKIPGNVTVNLKNVTCTSVICDNNYVDEDIINLNITNSNVEKVTLDASPFNNNGLNTYTNLVYNDDTRIDHINIQSGVNDLTHITINGANPTGQGEQQSKTYVDTINELQNAVNAGDENIVFGGNINGDVVMKSGVTIDGAGYKLNGSVNLNGADNVTLKNITFDAAAAKMGYDGKGTAKQNANIITGDNNNKPTKGAHNLVIDGCTFTGTFANGGAAIAFTDQGRSGGFSGNVTIKNCTFDTVGAYYDIYGYYTGNGSNGYGNFVIENNTFKTEFTQGGPIYLGRYASSTPVVLKGNIFKTVDSQSSAIYVQDHSNYGVSIDEGSNAFSG